MLFGEVWNGLSKDDRLWVNVGGTACAREVQGTDKARVTGARDSGNMSLVRSYGPL